jgi:SAM-dependent methyltransferase
MAGARGAGWLRFWNRPNPIQLDRRHRRAYYAFIAQEALVAAKARSGEVWLDFGCGEAGGTPMLLEAGIEVLLYDRSDRLRERAAAAFAAYPAVRVLDEAGFDALPPASVDVIAVVSVLQYLDLDEIRALLARWHALLRPGGRLVLGDIVPEGLGMFSDITALLRFARRHGYLGTALRSLMRTLASDYGRLRRELGLSTFTSTAMAVMLVDARFVPHRHHPNLGVNPQRMTFVATRIESAAS